MNRTIVTQSIFQTTPASSSSWRSYVTSGLVHIALIAILFAVTFPFIQSVETLRPRNNVTLIAPKIPDYSPKIKPQFHPKLPQIVAKSEIKLKPLPEIKPVQVKPRLTTAAPEIKNIAPVVTPHILPEPKIEAPAPKPEVHTGSFQSVDAAKAAPAPKVLKVGGFGDPNGVAPSADTHPSAVMMAKVGSFDMPAGSGNAGGGGHSGVGGVRQTAFGTVGPSEGVPGGTAHGSGVRTGSFGEAAPATADQSPGRPKPIEPVFTPVEIISKPKPAYTEEARNLKLEGQVSLEVVFLSNGSIRILRVVHGLGHGLDEAAQQAALQVRFRPATRGGVPVDTSATIHITFQLT